MADNKLGMVDVSEVYAKGLLAGMEMMTSPDKANQTMVDAIESIRVLATTLLKEPKKEHVEQILVWVSIASNALAIATAKIEEGVLTAHVASEPTDHPNRVADKLAEVDEDGRTKEHECDKCGRVVKGAGPLGKHRQSCKGRRKVKS